MKKFFIITFATLLLLGAGTIFLISMTLDRGVKAGVETLGPRLIQAPVRLEGVSLSPLMGKGSLFGLQVGNPEGYQTEYSIKAERITLALETSSLFSQVVHIREITVHAPEINLDGDPLKNNLNEIKQNILKNLGSSSSGSRQFQIDHLQIVGAKLHINSPLLSGKSVLAPIPDIHLKDLGNGQNGITAGELVKAISFELTKNSIAAYAKTISVENVKSAGEKIGDFGKDVSEKLKGLFK